jgi:hypothetical protein
MSKRLLCRTILISGAFVSVTNLASQDPAKDRPDLGMLSAIGAEELNHSKYRGKLQGKIIVR